MNKQFWYSAGIRALRTICQTAISLIGTSAVILSEVDWGYILSASLLAGILSVLTSIATGLPEVEYAQHVYMSAEEPEDSYVEEYEVFDYGEGDQDE